jgi:2-polyprenyl-6-methoxyphenol hydroxylase-like FAD-dependent oxidoreductase
MTMKETTHDVVIVGAGIGGAALAYGLAKGGLDVLMLERSETYADRVRGESFSPWGVVEAQRLGLLPALLAAGGNYVTKMIPYDEVTPGAAAEAAAVPMDIFVPGVPGIMTLPHTTHCQALYDAATGAGVTAVRGATVRQVEAGARPQVVFDAADGPVTARAKLVVGADGRPSGVREAFGVPIRLGAPRNLLGGLMVGGVDGWDASAWTIGTVDDFCLAVFPMGDGRVRAYGLWPADQRDRFAGADAARRFKSAFALDACPPGQSIADGEDAGPMLSFLNNETETDIAAIEGGVLIGDAGGWSDPVIGCGLANAYRDARSVRDVLLATDDWSPAAFSEWTAERLERRRRLHFTSDIITQMHCEFGEKGRARRRNFNEASQTDQSMLSHLIAGLGGPENQPPEMFTPEHRAHLLGGYL